MTTEIHQVSPTSHQSKTARLAARRCSSRLAAAGLVAALAAAAPPELGPWAVSELTFKAPALDATDPTIWLVFPVCNATSAPPGGCPRFPLVSYAHGMAGGDIDLLGYAELFYQLASYGFVVAAPDSCDFGCTDPSGGAPWTDCAGLPDVQPALWPAWYGELLKTIDWARNQTANATADPVFATIDFGAGVGIAGHSMGGQATAVAAGAACAERWGIKAAVLHHPANGNVSGGAAGNVGANMSVPVAAFTSSGDSIWPETVAVMSALNASAAAATLPSAFMEAVGWSHLEPVLAPPIENPLLATFTAAFFKVFLNGDRGAYFDLVYGGGPDSFCKHAPSECLGSAARDLDASSFCAS